MSIGIRGIGWVTPLGTGLEQVWARLMDGETGTIASLASPQGENHYYFPVPPKTVDHLGRTPRIRRSSAISYYTTAAGLAALYVLGDDKRLNDYQPYWAARAGLLARLGNTPQAVEAYDRAIGLERDPAVRRFLQAKRAILRH